MGFAHELIKLVIVEGDPEAAVNKLLSKYEDPFGVDAERCYSMWKKARHSILSVQENRHPEYFGKLGSLKDQLEVVGDIDFITKLEGSTLSYCHYVQSNRSRQFLSTLELDRQLKLILPVVDNFYEFVLPPQVGTTAKQIEQRSVLARHGGTHSRRTARLTNQQLGAIESTCVNIVHAVPRLDRLSPSDVADLCLALMVVTGRRLSEVLYTASFGPVPSQPYQSIVTGLLKDMDGDGIHRIPLVMDYTPIHHAMICLRNHANTATGERARVRGPIVFGVKLTHTERRNVYAELCWQRRNVNGFAMGCSKVLFTNKALCHGEGDFNTTTGYMAMTMED